MINPFIDFSRRAEVLGMNERNILLRRLNKGLKKIADNKLLTKKVLKKNNIPTPELFGVIRTRDEADSFDYENLPASFVLKPAKGVKGAGISIYYNRTKDGNWILANRKKHSIGDIRAQVIDILDGQFSLGITPKPSAALFEQRVRMHPVFKYYSFRGIPDIRVIVYRGVPVMAMLRLPTEDSNGKANINLGGLGVGIDMARGVTTTAIKNGLTIENVPGKNIKLSGIKIPFWTKILKIAHQCYATSGLGFLGVDIIIDKDKGPMVVELNARPGLGIQVANQDGLRDRIDKVKKIKNITEQKAVRIAKDLFGGEIDEELEAISGKEIIGVSEEITIIGKNDKEIVASCRIDTGAKSSSVDVGLARELGYDEVIDYFEKIKQKYPKEDLMDIYNQGKFSHPEIVDVDRIKNATGVDFRIKVVMNARLKDKEFTMKANLANRQNLTHPILVGRRDLKDFLIDISKGR